MRTRKRPFDIDIEQQILLCALDEDGPAAIEKHLKEIFPGREIPSKKTIGRRLNELKTRDESGPWLFEDAGPEEATAVIQVLASIITARQGRKVSVTNKEADWIARILTVAPDLPAIDVWHLVRLYMRYSEHKAPTTSPDAYLSFAPWRSDEAQEAYFQAWRNGWIQVPPFYMLWMIDNGKIETVSTEEAVFASASEGDDGEEG